jgi:hypothetical protein
MPVANAKIDSAILSNGFAILMSGAFFLWGLRMPPPFWRNTMCAGGAFGIARWKAAELTDLFSLRQSLNLLLICHKE